MILFSSLFLIGLIRLSINESGVVVIQVDYVFYRINRIWFVDRTVSFTVYREVRLLTFLENAVVECNILNCTALTSAEMRHTKACAVDIIEGYIAYSFKQRIAFLAYMKIHCTSIYLIHLDI